MGLLRQRKYFIRKLFQSPGLWKSCILVLLLPVLLKAQTSTSSFHSGPETRFLHFLNTWQADSLSNLLTDDFTYGWPQLTQLSYDRTHFLQGYLRISRECRGRFRVLSWIDTSDPVKVLLSDSSLWFSSGNVPPAPWIMTIYRRGAFISKVELDTTTGYRRYQQAMELEYRRFGAWLNTRYPGEEPDKLYDIPGLFIQRRNEFYRR